MDTLAFIILAICFMSHCFFHECDKARCFYCGKVDFKENMVEGSQCFTEGFYYHEECK